MLLKLSISEEAKAKQYGALMGIQGMFVEPILNADELHFDIESDYRMTQMALSGIHALVQDRSIPLTFRKSDITKLRGVVKGLVEKLSQIQTCLELRAT